MRIASFVLLVALMVTVSVAPAQIVNPANGHTYLLVGSSTQNVLVARFNANALGGYLVAINDPAEDAFIQANFPGSYWIGLSDSASEGTFVWDNGDPLTYTAWCPSEPSATAPNHDFVFMDTTDYDQVTVPGPVVGDAAHFMLENQQVTIAMHDGLPLYLDLPASVVLEVTYTEPGLQGDRSSAGTKPATVETGYEIQVPLFLETGTKVKVDTRTGDYLGRVS